MKLNKICNVLAATGLVCTAMVSSNVLAATNNYNFTMTTVADVTLTQLTELNFGGQLGLQAATTCELNIGIADDDSPSAIVAKISEGAPLAVGANFAELTGVGCGAGAVGTDGTVGVYEIVGAGGVDVDISLTSELAGTNFNFVPEGVTVSYDGAGNGDTFVAVTPALNGTAKLANTGDLSGNGPGSGVPAVGKTLLFVGGVITVNNTLLAGTEYTETFGIDVVYK